MKYIWSTLVISSIIYGIISDNYKEMYFELLSSVEGSLSQTLKLMTYIIFWNSLFKILDDCNILSKIVIPFKLIVKLFIKDKEEVIDNFAKSLAINSIGLGVCSITYTLNALSKAKPNNKYIIILVNIFPITIFPQTILNLRSSYGDSSNIWVYIFILSLIMFIISIIYSKLRYKNE